MVLIMTVEPGFGGQKFLDLCLPKIARTRALLDQVGGDIWLQIDGGVSVETIERCAEAGVDSFVAGSSVFGADDPDAMVTELRRLATRPAPELLTPKPEYSRADGRLYGCRPVQDPRASPLRRYERPLAERRLPDGTHPFAGARRSTAPGSCGMVETCPPDAGPSPSSSSRHSWVTSC